MEAEATKILLLRAKEYNMQYTKMIADCDSNVYPHLVKTIDYAIAKADCVEHTLRSLDILLFTESNNF
jgi:hypothetical protein